MRAIWCLLVVSVAVVYGKNIGNIVVIPPERAGSIVKVSSDCVEKLKLEKGILEKFFAWELSDSESNRKYMHCLGVDTGYIAKDGLIVKDEVLAIIGIDLKDKIAVAIDECNEKKYDDKYEGAFNSIMCFRDKSGLQFKV